MTGNECAGVSNVDAALSLQPMVELLRAGRSVPDVPSEAEQLAVLLPLDALQRGRELAQAEGIPVLVVQLIFMLLVAAVIALSMKIIGILLVTSLLIIPVSTARSFSNTPEQMAIGGALIGISSVFLGLWTSLHFDTPSGPSIVIVAVLFFFGSQILPFRKFKY